MNAKDIFRELNPGVEKIIEGVLNTCERLTKGERVFLSVELPTGYGKSTASIVAAAALLCRQDLERYFELSTYVERVVHVVPTRYLVEDLVSRARSMGVPARGQCLMFDPSFKDPYFLSPLVFSTFDSYALNFFKIPVGELELMRRGWSRGHFDVPRYAILSALNVFDEYHLLIPGDTGAEGGDYAARSLTTLYVIVEHLLGKCRVPVVLETATPSPSILGGFDRRKPLFDEYKPLRLLFAVKKSAPPKNSDSEIIVHDDSFSSKLLEARYETDVREGDVASVALELLPSLEKPLLVVCNTVKEAVGAYEKLKDKDVDAVLLHSLFTVRDRRRKLESLKRKLERGASDLVAVSTQVIEVGVDLDFASLVSDAAPLSALVQRVGRVNRKLRPEQAKVVIAFDPSKKIVFDSSKEPEKPGGLYAGVYDFEATRVTTEVLREAMGKFAIGWRITAVEEELQDDGRAVITITGLSKAVHERLGDRGYPPLHSKLKCTLRLLLNPLIGSGEAFKYLKNYGSFVREDVLAAVYVPEEALEEGALDRFDRGRLVPCSAARLGLLDEGHRAAARVLDVDDSGRIKAIVEGPEGLLVARADFEEVKKGLLSGIIKMGKDVYFLRALVAKPDSYDYERGLRLWVPDT